MHHNRHLSIGEELEMSDYVAIAIVAFLIGYVVGGAIIVRNTTDNMEVALKISNVMNSSMLDCISQKIITVEQEQLIEDVLKKHIEKEFKFIKVNSGDK